MPFIFPVSVVGNSPALSAAILINWLTLIDSDSASAELLEGHPTSYFKFWFVDNYRSNVVSLNVNVK